MIYNASGGVFDIQSDAGFSPGNAATGTVNNAGLFKKSAGSGTSTVSWVFNNTMGTVDVQSGTLSLAGGVSQLPGSTLTGGAWIVAGSSTLSIAAGDITSNQGSITLDGPGSTFANINTLANNQGTFTITDGRNFTAAGAFNNSGTASVGNGSILTLPGGGADSGAFNVSSGGNLSFTGGAHTFSNASFTNSGTIALNGGIENFSNAVVLPGVVNFSGGIVGFSGTDASAVTGPATFSGGMIVGTGVASFSNLTWTGGRIGGTGDTSHDRGSCRRDADNCRER